MLGSAKLFVDETTAPVLDPGRGRTKTVYFWAIARDDRPWGGSGPPAVVYTYAPGRGSEHAAALLKNFRGILQTDGYVAYKKVARSPGVADGTGEGVILAYCWAHCRRQFLDIAETGPAPIAQEALQRIAKLYDIEAEIRGLSAADRRAARQLRTKPLLDAMKLWLEQRAAELPRKSLLAEAVGYALNQWDGLVRFLDDGRIEIDSNTVERSMRPIALNRKNALFAGHDLGAENWAVLASLIETCKLHGVNSEAWLADVLTKLVNNWPNRRLAELTPWAWQAAQNTPERAAASAALPKRPRSNLQPSSKRKAGAPEAPLTSPVVMSGAGSAASAEGPAQRRGASPVVRASTAALSPAGSAPCNHCPGPLPRRWAGPAPRPPSVRRRRSSSSSCLPPARRDR